MYKAQLFARRICLQSVWGFIDAGADHIGWQCRLCDYNDDADRLRRDMESFAQIHRQITTAGARSLLLIEPATNAQAVLPVLQAVRPDIFKPGGEKNLSVLAAVRSDFPDMEIMLPVPIPVVGQARRGDGPLSQAEKYAPFCDWFLADTMTEDGRVGCLGRTSDWSILREFINNASRPVIAAGGLTPDNVIRLAAECAPAGMDAHSAVCGPDGRPDAEKAKAFVTAVHRIGEGEKAV